ncbi:helix-turn-helix domain-containing protein [Prevotella sp. OH937_COT-195]|uniref:helix-turn-helix domain-containing protein n=1 Tax=Prevotella sp. OH937_COT-195 TaxID=2491051 RepID=UPI000F64EC9D|nr:helix-turn-helix domain-containing protein [Prevotella sp. OH937_COT-195]RRD02552.1 DNA-binding protein [Prevotella sp. OH937_COT-195]
MKLIIIERNAWEHLRSSFTDFIHSVQQLIGNPPEAEQWIDNEAVCKRLGISKRTLQTYRDTGKIPFSMIGHKCYYKESDITEILNAIKNELKDLTSSNNE